MVTIQMTELDMVMVLLVALVEEAVVIINLLEDHKLEVLEHQVEEMLVVMVQEMLTINLKVVAVVVLVLLVKMVLLAVHGKLVMVV